MADTDERDIEDRLSDLVEDRTFGELTAQFGRFNLFEAAGTVRRELDHSNFLAYLLSPNRPHGLGAEPLRRVLKAMLEAVPKSKRPLRILNILIEDLDDALVFRERDNIDLLIELERLKLVILVENKVGARAGDGQLDRYAKIVSARYPDWQKLFIFLTPYATDPEDDRYAAFSYSALAVALDGLLDTANHEIGLVLRHYLQLLRRKIVEDENLKELALKIYDRHKEAFDFVIACLPEPGSLLPVVDELIKLEDTLEADRRQNSISRFVPKVWLGIPALNATPSDQWTKTSRSVLFEVKSFKTEAYDYSDRILLSLIMGPADLQLREYLFAQARKNPAIFSGAGSSVGKSWATLFSRELLSKAAAKNMDDDQKSDAIRAAWAEFVKRDLPALTAAMIEVARGAPTRKE